MQLKQISTAMVAYASEHDDTLPPAEDWMAEFIGTGTLDPSIYEYPGTTDQIMGMNSALGGTSLPDIPEPHRTVLLFETGVDGPRYGGLDDLAAEPRSRRDGWWIVTVDGTIDRISDFSDFVWELDQ